jgi:hypothetical protein
MGIVKITVKGKVHPDVRVIASNHLFPFDIATCYITFPSSYLAMEVLKKNYFDSEDCRNICFTIDRTKTE